MRSDPDPAVVDACTDVVRAVEGVLLARTTRVLRPAPLDDDTVRTLATAVAAALSTAAAANWDATVRALTAPAAREASC